MQTAVERKPSQEQGEQEREANTKPGQPRYHTDDYQPVGECGQPATAPRLKGGALSASEMDSRADGGGDGGRA